MIKKKMIRYSSGRALKKNKVSRENPSFHAAELIGVIFSWEGEKKEEIIKKFLDELDLSGKKIETVCFIPVKQKDSQVPEAFLQFTEKDFNLFGTVKSPQLERFINRKFDFLFHLDTLTNIYIENVLAKSLARCRVSRLDFSKKEFYDFMIKTADGEGIEQLCKQILHYTKTLVSYG